MDAILIEFFVGIAVIAFKGIDGSLKQPSFHWVSIVVGAILIALAIFGFNPLTLR